MLIRVFEKKQTKSPSVEQRLSEKLSDIESLIPADGSYLYRNEDSSVKVLVRGIQEDFKIIVDGTTAFEVCYGNVYVWDITFSELFLQILE
jgi:hypothetical protein